MPDMNNEADVHRHNAELEKRVAELEDVITERKQLDAELLVKSMVFEASIIANSTSDNEGILTYVNSAFVKIFGFENKEEAVGKPIGDFLKFEDEAMNIITALNENGVWEGECTGLRNDGTTFAAYGLATIIKDRSGDSIGYQSAVLDISDRKRREKREAHRNSVLRAVRSVNQLITGKEDRDRLLQGACDNLIRESGYHNSWIALLDDFGRLEACAEAGLAKLFIPMVKRLQDGKMTRCGSEALEKPGVVLTEDPSTKCADCPLSGTYAGRSGLTARLEYGGKTYGLMAVSVPSTGRQR